MTLSRCTERVQPREVDCIVAYCKGQCGRMIFATVNEEPNMNAACKKEIGEFVVDGYKVEHMPVSGVRKAPWGCKCPKTGKLL